MQASELFEHFVKLLNCFIKFSDSKGIRYSACLCFMLFNISFCFMVVFRKSTTQLAVQSTTQHTSPSATKLIKTNFRFTQNGVKSATMNVCVFCVFAF